MQDSGSTQSSLPLVVTRQVDSHQNNTSHQNREAFRSTDAGQQQDYPEAKSLEEYVGTRKSPYAFEYFALDKSVKGIHSFQNWANGIDDFVRLEITNNKLSDSLETYDNIISSIMKGIGLNKDTIGSVKMEKLYRWINEVIRPQKLIEYRKKEILGQ